MAQINDLKNYVCDALEVIEFGMIREPENVNDYNIIFRPEMAHQIFGETEKIFGYADLNIQIFFSAGPLDVYYKLNYSKKVEELKTEGLLSDDLDKAITGMIEDGSYYTNLEEFLEVMKTKMAAFKPFGEKIDEFETAGRTFEVYVCDMDTPGFLKYHSKFETISFWFIDAFSRLEVDPLWKYFVVYEKYTNKKNEVRYASVGYCTVYQYFSYPANIRPRISQIMILPPFQKMGIASRLIEYTLYNYYVPMETVTDITYEEPTKIVTKIRLSVDAKRCKLLPAFSTDKLKTGFSKQMLKEAKEKYKISPQQCRLVYELLRLSQTNMKNEQEYKDYRIQVKKRLNLNYSKYRRELSRAQKKGADVKNALAGLPSIEERRETLNAEYKDVEKEYLTIINKVAPATN